MDLFRGEAHGKPYENLIGIMKAVEHAVAPLSVAVRATTTIQTTTYDALIRLENSRQHVVDTKRRNIASAQEALNAWCNAEGAKNALPNTTLHARTLLLKEPEPKRLEVRGRGEARNGETEAGHMLHTPAYPDEQYVEGATNMLFGVLQETRKNILHVETAIHSVQNDLT
ncbi:hypothetical protein ERJ75_000611500 [Trypanosoma vivax]|nr:hypothetical protein ERJ75_000611500 [Trypanosoma vivax]